MLIILVWPTSCSAHDEWLIMKLCMYVGYHDANNVSNFGGDPVAVVVVVCFHDLKFCLSSQLKATSCAWCSSEMPSSKQVNGHSFTICLIVWCSTQSQSGEAM